MLPLNKAEWFKACRPHLEWVNWHPAPDWDAYVEGLIGRAKAMNSDTLVYAFESGGRLLYPGSLAPMYKPLQGRDLLGLIEREAHKHGLRFVVCFLGVSANGYMTDEHPDWVQRDADGNPIPQWHGYNFRSMCPNTPYSEYLFEIARDLLTRYPLDGIYLEGVYIARGYCYCPHCQTAFRARYARDIPRENLDSDRDYSEFRQKACLRPFRLLRKAIDETRPEAAFFACIGASYWFREAHLNIADIAPYADVVAIEGQWNYDLDVGYDPSFALQLPEMGLVMQAMRAEGGKPVLGTVWIAKHVDQNYAPRTSANVILNFQELLFQGSMVQTHTQNALEVDTKHLSTLKQLYQDATTLAPFLTDARILAQAGLLHWASPADRQHYFDFALRGWHKACLEYHLPYRLITPREVLAGTCADCPVWVLPSVLELDDSIIKRVLEHVTQGGGVVMTYRTLSANSRLARLAGVRSVLQDRPANKSRFPLHDYYRIRHREGEWKDLAGTLRSFQGSLLEVECEPDVDVAGWTLALDHSRMSRDHILQVAYPGHELHPLVLLRTVGKGRVCCITGDIDAAARRYGDAQSLELLATAINWAAARPTPFTTSCPPSVECHLHESAAGLAVVLLNLTSNQYLTDPIRYVVPLHHIEVTVRRSIPGNARVQTLTGQSIRMTSEPDITTFQIEQLREYEAILIPREV